MTKANAPINQQRPEIELLLACARVGIDEACKERICRLLAEEIDWEYLYSSAQDHGLSSLLYSRLNSLFPEAIPTDYAQKLREHFLWSTIRNQSLFEELGRVLGLLENEGIPVIPLKGPYLALKLYGDLALRWSSDLDIMVRKVDTERAKEVLLANGYESSLELTEKQKRIYLRTAQDYNLLSKTVGIILELHWYLVPNYFSLPVNYEDLWKGARRQKIHGATALSFALEDELFILCLEACKDSFRRVSRLCDIAAMITRAREEIDWPSLIQRAKQRGSRRILFLCLSLVSDLLDAPVPVQVMLEVRSDVATKRFSNKVREYLLANSLPQKRLIVDILFHLKMRECLRDRVRYCMRFILTTNPVDWAAVPLPDSLFNFYYLVRALRLFRKHLFFPRS